MLSDARKDQMWGLESRWPRIWSSPISTIAALTTRRSSHVLPSMGGEPANAMEDALE